MLTKTVKHEFIEKLAINQVLSNEGGFVHDPDDRGGMTYCGVSRKNFPNWAGWEYIDQLLDAEADIPKPREDTFMEPLVREFYEDYYRNSVPSNFLPTPFLVQFFSMGFVSGKRAATRCLQRALATYYIISHNALHIEDDGIVGPSTTGKYNTVIVNDSCFILYSLYKDACVDFFMSIVEARPNQHKFLEGWHNRARHDYDTAIQVLCGIKPGIHE